MVPRPPEPRPVPTVDDHARRATRSNRKSNQSLASSIESELLRGIPLQLVIGGCGRLWFNQKVDDYNLSQCVPEIDSFLSHDWGTSPWLKVITMLVYFNSVPAAVASGLVTVVVGLLIIFKCVDGWLTCTLAVHGTYWFVFVLWQNIRCLYKKNFVFLDRVCIAQHDANLKTQGILGLGGFLSKSRRLVVLWSPRYFTRLWTAFELAAFLKEDQGKAGAINFAPASMGPLLLYFTAFETLLVASFHILMVQFVQTLLGEQNLLAEQQDNWWQLTVAMLVICAPAFFVIAPVVLYLGTMQMKALLQLKKQLDDFKIRAAQCSCCDLHHCHPETGEALVCDRALVFETLRRWFPNEESEEAHLDRFDEMVHTQLRGFVRDVFGSGAPPLNHILAITVHPLLGFLCHYIYLATNDYFGWTALGWMIGWFQAPPMVYLAFWEFLQCWRMGVKFGERCPLWLVLLLGMSAGIFFNVVVWLQYTMIKYMFGHDFNWPVVGSLAFMWLLFVLPYVYEYAPKFFRKSFE